ncbi:MAG: hypothetical protein IPH62_15460 [Ignavibacteriae bacterium]|nr:hypothetical protein [Ignavibacteriota bacterium]
MEEFNINEFSKRLKIEAKKKYGNIKIVEEKAEIANLGVYTKKNPREPRATILYKLALLGFDINYLLTGKSNIEELENLKKEVNRIMKRINEIS